MKKTENKTKALSNQAEELRIKLKEKDTMLRIAKFKLSEVQRNIKHSTMKPKEREESTEPKMKGGGAGVPVSSPKEKTAADLIAKQAYQKRKEEKKRQEEEALNAERLKMFNKQQKLAQKEGKDGKSFSLTRLEEPVAVNKSMESSAETVVNEPIQKVQPPPKAEEKKAEQPAPKPEEKKIEKPDSPKKGKKGGKKGFELPVDDEDVKKKPDSPKKSPKSKKK